MTERKDGGPAFSGGAGTNYTGMTLRQWYAGEAMKALLSQCGPFADDIALRDVAERAVEMADELICVESES